MHISLDSALGQQRRLNQVGETISSIAAPTLAYSLRSLTGGDPKAVRVRRVSNDEQDFTVSGISSGALVDFALNNTKSLLNSRAYFDGSNDSVGLTNEIDLTGDFSVEYSFVVTETEQQIIGKNASGSYLRAQGTGEITAFRIQTNSGAESVNLTSNLKYGEANTIKLKRVSGKFGIYDESDVLISAEFTNSDTFTISSFGKARGSFAKGVIYNIRIDTNNDGTIDHSYNGYGNSVSDWTDLVGSNNAAAVNGSPALFTGQDQDGFVGTWYDQSGNSNNLTQATASKQPTIVTSGAINTRNSQPIIKFIQANSTVLHTADSTMFPTGSSLAVTIFHAMHIDASSGSRIGVFGHNNGGNNAGTNRYRFGSQSSRRVLVKFADASSTQVLLQSGFYTDNTDSILTYQFALNGGTASLQAFNNGSSLTDVSASTTDQSYSPQADKLVLGARSTADNFSDSEFFEVIAYDSDQLSNRSAIETNMNSHYSIF